MALLSRSITVKLRLSKRNTVIVKYYCAAMIRNYNLHYDRYNNNFIL